MKKERARQNKFCKQVNTEVAQRRDLLLLVLILLVVKLLLVTASELEPARTKNCKLEERNEMRSAKGGSGGTLIGLHSVISSIIQIILRIASRCSNNLLLCFETTPFRPLRVTS